MEESHGLTVDGAIYIPYETGARHETGAQSWRPPA